MTDLRKGLSYEEVEIIVADLPKAALRVLSLGPYPEDNVCRVCDVLSECEGEGAKRLHEWHDPALNLTAWRDALVNTGIHRVFDGSPLHEQVKEAVGALGYTRCALIYAIAAHHHGPPT